MAKINVSKRVLGKIEGLLACINPDVDFDTFHEIMGLIYVETYGSHKGLALLDDWYSNSDEYPGDDALVDMWCSYLNDEERYFGMGMLMHLASENVKLQATAKTKTKAASASARTK